MNANNVPHYFLNAVNDLVYEIELNAVNFLLFRQKIDTCQEFSMK